GTPVFRRFPAGLQACNHPEEHSIAQVGVYQNENQTVENVYCQALQWSPGFGVKNKCKKLEEVETIVLKNYHNYYFWLYSLLGLQPSRATAGANLPFQVSLKTALLPLIYCF